MRYTGHCNNHEFAATPVSINVSFDNNHKCAQDQRSARCQDYTDVVIVCEFRSELKRRDMLQNRCEKELPPQIKASKSQRAKRKFGIQKCRAGCDGCLLAYLLRTTCNHAK